MGDTLNQQQEYFSTFLILLPLLIAIDIQLLAFYYNGYGSDEADQTFTNDDYDYSYDSYGGNSSDYYAAVS